MNSNYEKALEFYNNEEYEKAIEFYKKGMAGKDAKCAFGFARMLFNGKGAEKDVDKANEIFANVIDDIKALAENDDSVAQKLMGHAYYYGHVVKQDYSKAIEWYEKAADNGDISSQGNLGYIFEFGEGTEIDYQKAKYWYEKAARQGDVSSQSSLAWRYAFGEEKELDYLKAKFWYEKVAQKNNPHAQYVLGYFHEYGKCGEVDYQQAMYWYEKAAKQGFADAQNALGSMYKFGEGVEINYLKAKYWYEKAAKQGDEDAQSRLGGLYFFGEGIEQNYKKSKYWYEKAAKQGEVVAQFNLGCAYLLGHGVAEDYKKAIYWFEKAASQGNSSAQYNLALIYYYGKHVEKNYQKAVKYLKTVIETGYCDGAAFYYLGDCYQNGLGVKADWKKAKEYYKEAIKRGYNCKFALDMVKADLKEFDGKTEIQNYAKHVLSLGIHAKERVEKIEQDLQKEFGENWQKLKPEAQKSLVSGVFSYINFYELGEETYKDLDFTPSITAMCKALEITLAEYFFKGYLKYLKENNISASVFDANSCFLKVDRNNDGLELSREYRDEEETKHFSLGAFYYIIDSKFEVMSSAQIAIREETADSERSVSYRKKYRYAKEGDKSIKIEGERTLNKHVAEYADSIFTEEAFSSANREKEIVNYLVDLSTDVFVIMQQRNPAAHGETMSCKHAEICGDYLIKVRKLICNILSKIKDEYK